MTVAESINQNTTRLTVPVTVSLLGSAIGFFFGSQR